MTRLTGNLLGTFEPLSAYGEYSEEVAAQVQKNIYRPANHLAGALSPYLQLHASDPVGWFTWSQEAFNTARALDRPLFVSIGFYSEHWCRKMHHDCFSDNEAAGLINDTCIPVCVDAEERPDVNDIFMDVCRLQSGSAGWPLNVFLTPEGRPFFAATFLPKRTMGQLPGLTEIIPRVKWLWHVQRPDVDREAEALSSLMKARCDEMSGGTRGRARSYADMAIADLSRIFDVRWGGFGGPQKFPEVNKLLFLLEYARLNKGSDDAVTMTDITLRRMWRGGIHDHLAGGFARYAGDERWLVPHFEKLLSVQALLLYVVSLAHELRPNMFYKMFADDIVSCVLKCFALDESYSQAFRSSICGDVDGSEGKYYLWTEQEIKQVLGDAEAGLFCAAYGVLPGGNYSSELGGTQIGKNILYEASTVSDLSKRYGIKAEDVAATLHRGREKLREYRDQRYPMNADDKVLMSANGLIIAALSKASRVFESPDWKDIAERSALFLLKSLRGKDGKYYRVWSGGMLSTSALSEDYAFFLWGLMELYRASEHFKAGEKQLSDWRTSMREIAGQFIDRCWNDENSCFELSDKDDRRLFIKLLSAEDRRSEPNANAVGALVLHELGILLQEEKYREYASRIVRKFGSVVKHERLSMLSLIAADMLNKTREVPKPPAPKTETRTEKPGKVPDDDRPPQAAAPSPEQSEATSSRKPAASGRVERKRRSARTREGRKARE